MNNGGGGGRGGVRIAKMKTVFRVALPSCRFHVVASTLSQEGKNMVAMFTKLACLHALLISFLYMSVLVCTLPSIPDSTVTGTLKSFFCLIKLH